MNDVHKPVRDWRQDMNQIGGELLTPDDLHSLFVHFIRDCNHGVCFDHEFLDPDYIQMFTIMTDYYEQVESDKEGVKCQLERANDDLRAHGQHWMTIQIDQPAKEGQESRETYEFHCRNFMQTVWDEYGFTMADTKDREHYFQFVGGIKCLGNDKKSLLLIEEVGSVVLYQRRSAIRLTNEEMRKVITAHLEILE